MFDPMITLLLFTSAAAGALFYRMRGGPLTSWPRPLEQMLFCVVFGAVMDALSVHFGWQISGYVLAVVAVLSGHGQYFLARVIKPIEPETLDFVVRWIMGPDPRCDERFAQYWDHDGDGDTQWMDGYGEAVKEIQTMVDAYGMRKLFWRCTLGFSVTGGAVSLGPGLMVMLFSPHLLAGLFLALSGFVAKPLAYVISHALGKGTEGGEWGFGGLQWFFAVLVAVVTTGVLWS